MGAAGFHLWYDTRGEALAERFAELVVASAGADPLVPRTVLVPQLGLERWLTRVLAERHGIAANLEFIAPAQFARRLLRAEHGELLQRSPFDRELLVWRLFDLLPGAVAAAPALAELLPPAAADDALRRLQLAQRLAHLFERYQAYRPQMLQRWERGADADNWQAALWRALVAATPEAPRSRLQTDYVTRFGASGAARPAGLPETLFAWGCITVSPLVLDMLRVAARHVPLHFFMPTPCREYWGDLPPRRHVEAYEKAWRGFMDSVGSNRLLISLGGLGREFVARVFLHDEVQEHSADGGEPPEPARATLLQRVQADIISLQAPPAEDRFEPQAWSRSADDSLQIHACHSPLREVEVLHDHLLDLLERNPDLEPRDIVVMMPDVARHAAAVEAVFGALPAGDPRHVPWTLADRRRADAHPLGALFLQLLSLPASRLDVDEVLGMLDVPAVRAAAGIDAEALAGLRERALAAGIRWGADAADREARDLPAFDEFSWAFGRRRLLLGYLLGDDADAMLVHGTAPLADLEGDAARATGALAAFARRLHALRAAMAQPRPPAGWRTLFTEALAWLCRVDDDDRGAERALADFRAALAALADDAAAAGFDAALDWRCVRELLGRALDAPRSGQRYMSGGVSVCAMVPMRDVPFRVVCVLGLDADAFPRRDDDDALSLIERTDDASRRVLGDRSVREDDRYLFLQTLMAARDHLYLSWVGTDQKSNKRREPALPLAELIEHVCGGYFTDAEKAREALVTRQPMTPFSPRLFAADAGPRVFTYRHEWRAAAAVERGGGTAAAFAATARLPAAEAAKVIELDDLKDFLAAPQKHFLQRRAGIAIARAEHEPGREPLELNGLQRWQLRQALLPAFMAPRAPAGSELLTPLRARGLLPPLASGELALEREDEKLRPQARDFQIWTEGAQWPGADRAVELDLGAAGKLRGTVRGIYARGFGGWVGSGKAKYWMRWWLDALAWQAGREGAGAGRAWGEEKDDKHVPVVPRTVALPEPAAAWAALQDLVQLYRDALEQPVLVPPESGWMAAGVLAGAPRKNESAADLRARAVNAALKTWNDRNWPESADPWIALLLRGRDPFVDAAERDLEVVERIWLPLRRALHAEVPA